MIVLSECGPTDHRTGAHGSCLLCSQRFSRAACRCMGCAMVCLGCLNCFTLSRVTVFPGVSLGELEDSFNPLFKGTPYAVSWVRKLVDIC